MAEPKTNQTEKRVKVEDDRVAEVNLDVANAKGGNPDPKGGNPLQLSAAEQGIDELNKYNEGYLDQLNFLEKPIEVTVHEGTSVGDQEAGLIQVIHQGKPYYFRLDEPREVPRKVFAMLMMAKSSRHSFRAITRSDGARVNGHTERQRPRWPISYASLATSKAEKLREQEWIKKLKRTTF